MGLVPPNADTTFYTPLTVISSCLEVNTAVLCASIPVFWPVIKHLGFSGPITVVNEVTVKSEPRSNVVADDRLDDDERQLTWDPLRQNYPLKETASRGTLNRSRSRSSVEP